jgi:hypothetical protein
VEPIADAPDGEHLVVVPHGLLHHLPFHTLDDGGGCLADRIVVFRRPALSPTALLVPSGRPRLSLPAGCRPTRRTLGG